MKTEMNNLILLHVCCAPCSAGCVGRLLEADKRITLFYSNSNIATRDEFERRLDSVEKLAAIYDLPLEIDPYDHAAWLAQIAGFEGEPERGARCPRCFNFSFARTAARAGALGCSFASTLTVSPHKSSKLLLELGSGFENFEAWDFKKKDGFKTGRDIAQEHGFYFQNFCGCEFSKR